MAAKNVFIYSEVRKFYQNFVVVSSSTRDVDFCGLILGGDSQKEGGKKE
jgi:hypothetical protein